jgi:NAD(P)-dependent dehydrogenase (short-subunit alcohol dehydrogenase family)
VDGNENELVKIVIFGSNGPTGRQLVKQALANGHEVAAVTRHPEQIPPQERLSVVRADVTDPAAVDAAVADSDAVLSALGVPYTRKHVTAYSVGTANIIAAMDNHGLGWTITRACWLFNAPRISDYKLCEGSIRAMFTSRADLAACLLAQLSGNQHVRKTIGVVTTAGERWPIIAEGAVMMMRGMVTAGRVIGLLALVTVAAAGCGTSGSSSAPKVSVSSATGKPCLLVSLSEATTILGQGAITTSLAPTANAPAACSFGRSEREHLGLLSARGAGRQRSLAPRGRPDVVRDRGEFRHRRLQPPAELGLAAREKDRPWNALVRAEQHLGLDREPGIA